GSTGCDRQGPAADRGLRQSRRNPCAWRHWSSQSMNPLASWQSWALLSAVFAALTAIFAKVGIENVNSDFATFVRTIVILGAAAAMVTITGSWQSPGAISSKSWTFLVLSGLATGFRWICYFRCLKLGHAA